MEGHQGAFLPACWMKGLILSAGRGTRLRPQGLAETVPWYQANERWWQPIKQEDPAFRSYYQSQYGERRA